MSFHGRLCCIQPTPFLLSMLVSRGRNPNAAEVISQLIGNSGLRNRVLTTLSL